MAKEFEKHMMYDPETGKGYEANTHEDHVRMGKMGYVHEKPKGPFKVKQPYNIATGGTSKSNPWLTSLEAKAGEGEYLGGFPEWSKVSDAKDTLSKIMEHQEKFRKIKQKGKENKEKENLDDDNTLGGDTIKDDGDPDDNTLGGDVRKDDGGDVVNPNDKTLGDIRKDDGDPDDNTLGGDIRKDDSGGDTLTPTSKENTGDNLGSQQSVTANDANQNIGAGQSYNRKQRNQINNSYPKNNVNPNVAGITSGKNSGISNALGGGEFRKFTNKSVFNNDGQVSGYVSKGKDAIGKSWNYSFDIKEDANGLRTISFNKNVFKGSNGAMKQIFRNAGVPVTGELSAAQWKKLRGYYTTKLQEVESSLAEIQQKYSDYNDVDKSQKIYSDFLDKYPVEGVQLLKMKSRGFFNGDLQSDAPTQYKTPIQFKSPFPRRDLSIKRYRENWMPSAPMNYGSPLRQQEQLNINSEFGTIWEKMKAYGPTMDKKIDTFIKHTKYDPTTDKPINSFQNKEWVNIITKWLQGKKAEMVKATNEKNNDVMQQISTSVNTLIQDVTTYSGKFLDWMDRNAGDAAEGNAGGSVVSQGSRKDEKFIGNITFMGDKNTTIGIAEDGKIGIKSFGLPNVKYVEELDFDVFAKDSVGHAQFIEVSESLQKLAESGKPLNKNTVKGNADQLLKNEDSILSWAFDPLYGQSWLQDYLEGNPNADVEKFMPESNNFDLDLLTDEVHGWLVSKLTESYNKNVPQQEAQPGQGAQKIMDETMSNIDKEKENKQGVYAEKTEQQQTLPQQGQVMAQAPPPPPPPSEENSPMSYKDARKKRALELIRKFS
tara:strand:- start:309 stop:2777 length:2469 start_codon:yes stop_codon:yes gene_type:complete